MTNTPFTFTARDLKVAFLVVALTLATVTTLAAQIVPRVTEKSTDSVGSIVYDTKQREFRCWSDGVLQENYRQHLCDNRFGWHLVNSNLYFVRGQSLSLVVMNGIAEDIFTLDIKAEALAEPTAPISGTITDLPKLQPIPAVPTVLAGTNSTFVSGASPVKASTIYRLSLTADESDFNAWIQTNIVGPLNAKEVSDLLVLDLDTALAQAAASSGLITPLKSLKTDLEAIREPRNMDEWGAGVKALQLLLDREGALRLRLTINGISSAGATINSALAASRTTAVQ